MPIDSLKPKTVGQYFQPVQPVLAAFHVEFSCTATVRFAAMPVTSFDAFLRGGLCFTFADQWVPRSDDGVILFNVAPNTPWLIVAVNQSDEPVAIYWRAFIRRST